MFLSFNPGWLNYNQKDAPGSLRHITTLLSSQIHAAFQEGVLLAVPNPQVITVDQKIFVEKILSEGKGFTGYHSPE